MADVGFVDQASDEIEADWAAVRFDFDRDTVIAEAPDGSIGAYGIVLALDPSIQIFAMGKVHPHHAGRGLGTALLAETERRAGARLLAGARAPFRTGTPETDRPAVGLFTSRGYRHVRSFWHMQRHLGEHPAPEPPEGITMRIGSAGDDEGPPTGSWTTRSGTTSATSRSSRRTGSTSSAACPGTTPRSW